MAEAEGYEGVTVAGIALVRRDGGTSVFLTQRAMDETDAPDVQESWEVPGGHLNPGEEPFEAAKREFEEELGYPLPEGEVVNGWRSEDGAYQGFVYEATSGGSTADWTPTAEVQAIGWFDVSEDLPSPLRPEMAAFDWSLLEVSGNEDPFKASMDAFFARVDERKAASETVDEESDGSEPEFDPADLIALPIPIHGVMAPEEVESGDARAFSEGAMTTRPLRLPFRWQKADIGGHSGAIVVGSVDRLMRKDGMIHYEGLLMTTPEAGELIDVIEFFGRFGVSVDGDRGLLDEERTKQTGVTWHEAVRAAGLTAVAIPAFAEAYVALGPHPDFAAESEASDVALTAGACSPGLLEFKRGPGWVTNPKETSRLHTYWISGEGAQKIRWGTPGDFTRAKALIGEKIAKNSPEKMKYLNQIIARWHHDALGYWPGDLDMPGNKTSAEARAERSLGNEGIELTKDGWDAVLVSSITGARVSPPVEYFHRNESASALTIEDPDENGLIRTYGYAGEWGVCHVGMSGECVEPPISGSDDYPDFHLGRTKTTTGYISTGVLTCGVGHRDAKQILQESPNQAYFDNISNAWAAVRVGEDERGIWFAGVLLPGVDPDLVVKIEASGQVSGEWLHGAMRACLTVNVPGFPVHRATAEYDASGNVVALAASAFGTLTAAVNGTENSPCAERMPTPRERIQALATIDSAARMQVLRNGWED